MEDQKLTKKQLRDLKRQKKMEQRVQSKRNGSIKKYLIWSGMILLVVGGFWFLKKISIANQDLFGVLETDRVKGDSNATLTLFEYGDYQCPACSLYHKTIEQFMAENGSKVRLVYRHFPLTQIHKNAFSAALASEAAGKQDKFWEMHNLLYDRQNEWSKEENVNVKDIFASYAQNLGLDKETFLKDLNSPEVEAKVRQDIDFGNKLKVDGTPSFFLNGEKISLVPNIESFRAKILGQ